MDEEASGGRECEASSWCADCTRNRQPRIAGRRTGSDGEANACWKGERRRCGAERRIHHHVLLVAVVAAILNCSPVSAIFNGDLVSVFGSGHDLGPIKFLKKPQNVTVKLGEPFNISCKVKAGSFVTMTLLLNGKFVETKFLVDKNRRGAEWDLQEMILSVAAAQSSNAGVYSCNVKSSSGRTAMANGRVQVQGESKPELVTSHDQTISAGRDVTLQCTALGLPTPVRTWSLPPYVQPGRRVLVDEARGTVTIIDVETRHNGVYTCRARNKLGETSRAVHLTVIGGEPGPGAHTPVPQPPGPPSTEPAKTQGNGWGISDRDLIIIIACSGATIVIACVVTLLTFVVLTRRRPAVHGVIKRQLSPQVNTESTTGTISTHSPSQTVHSDEEVQPTPL